MGRKHYGVLGGFYAGVVVTEISPAYYATFPTSGTSVYRLKGFGFNSIPAGAVGRLSYSNNNPQAYKEDDTGIHSYSIEVVSNNEIIARKNSPTYTVGDTYLGCICSADGSVVYWTNETKPLP